MGIPRKSLLYLNLFVASRGGGESVECKLLVDFSPDFPFYYFLLKVGRTGLVKR